MITENVDLYFRNEVDKMDECLTTLLYASEGHTSDLEQALDKVDKDAVAAKIKEVILPRMDFDAIQRVERFIASEEYQLYMEMSEVFGTVFQEMLAEVAAEL